MMISAAIRILAKTLYVIVITPFFAILAVPTAHATLTLTAAGIADGFSLSVFATMNPGNTGYGAAGCCAGPFGLAVTSAGEPTVFVADVALNAVYTFHDTDGQTPSSATNVSSGYAGAIGATAVGSTFWGTSINSASFQQFATYSSNLSSVSLQTVLDASGSPYLGWRGMATNAAGHIIAAAIAADGSHVLIEITPGNRTARLIVGSLDYYIDGVSLSPDGTKVILGDDVTGMVYVYRTSDGALLHTYNPGNAPDGTGVIASGVLKNAIVVAGNSGTLDLIDVNGDITTIATGNTRLDYTAPDLNNGTLLIDSADIIYRLSCSGPQCFASVPEPSTLGIVPIGLIVLGWARLRQKGGRANMQSRPV